MSDMTLETERRITSLEVRVDKMEEVIDEIHTLSSAVVKLCEEVKHMSSAVNKIDTRVQLIEDTPRDTIKTLRHAIITSAVSLIVGAVLSALIIL